MNPQRPQADCRRISSPRSSARQWDAYYEPRNAAFREAALTGQDLVRWKYKRYMHDYLGCIKAVDESVGPLLKYLDAKGSPRTRSSSTRPTRASTSASTAGSTSAGSSRSRSARRCWSAGRASRRPGAVNQDLVSHLDFAETFLEAAGVPVPAEMQGRSLVPLAQGRDAGRLAEELLLPLLRVPGAQRPPALRRRDRPLQARPLLRPGRGLLGALRSGEGPARAAQRVRTIPSTRRHRRNSTRS